MESPVAWLGWCGEGRRVMKVHAVQFEIAWEDRAANHRRVCELTEGLGAAAGDLVVLPEVFATGFSMEPAATCQGAAREDEVFLGALARSLGCAVVGGVISPGDPLPRNEAVAVGPDGDLLARYVKRRPFSLVGETGVHARGEEVAVFPWGGFRVGLLVCYDLRFPELARETVAAGADLLVVVANWPIKRVEHWITLLRARAMENLCYVVGVNRCGRDPRFTYPGRSLVVDPHGIVLGDAADREGVLTAPCDPGVVRRWRDEFPALGDAGMRVPPG